MIRLILFLIVAVALALLAAWFADHPGRVSLVWQGMQIETSVAVAVVAAVVAAVIVVLAFEILRLVRAAPRRLRAHRRHARTDRGYQALSQGLVAAAAGDAAAAKALNRRAEKLLDHRPATLLLSAQSAQLEGDEGAARARFQQMLQHPETEFLGLRGLLAQSIKDGDTTSALSLARRAQLRRPNTPWVLTTLFELQTQAGLWEEALGTVDDMARHKQIDRPTATRWRAILYHQLAVARRQEGRPYEALSLARKAHKLLPGLAPIAVQASELAEQTSQPRVVRKVLEAAWQAQPHPALAQAWLAQAGGQSPAERLKHAEKLHQLEPDHLESDLMLAEQAIAARQWQSARNTLERARKRGPTASVYRLLAEVEQAEGQGEKARAWLAKAVDAPPDPAWLCPATGEARASWSPFGPDGRFDSLRWGSPPKIVPLLRSDAAAQLIPPAPAPGPAAANGGKAAPSRAVTPLVPPDVPRAPDAPRPSELPGPPDVPRPPPAAARAG
jgi:HemY protein